jgi:hypothetical protein
VSDDRDPMYHTSVPVFLQQLNGLNYIIHRAETYATRHKWQPDTLLNYRLHPGMFTLASHVRHASEHALSAGRAAGVNVPELPKVDNSLEEVRARIEKTLDFLKNLDPDHFQGREDARVTFTVRGQSRTLNARTYLYEVVTPNFFFHVVSVYDIIARLGVSINRQLPGEPPSDGDPDDPPEPLGQDAIPFPLDRDE